MLLNMHPIFNKTMDKDEFCLDCGLFSIGTNIGYDKEWDINTEHFIKLT